MKDGTRSVIFLNLSHIRVILIKGRFLGTAPTVSVRGLRLAC